MRNFMKPSNWEMKIFSKEGKKRYILWNTFFHLSQNGYANANDVPEILKKLLKAKYSYAGDSPEEAIEKWIDYLFNGKESLSTIRMHAAIEGKDIP